ncbi:MAG: class I SAM-dependent methyltransferase [Chitinophagaceae bacterium]|jgi:SAM-dependent methyltransferase|nr:class I SAM-dependent methyltransferase [Chitinophagaceae bacterium]
MITPTIAEIIGNTDIYLIDQILKGRYGAEDRILDAGCGHGRNLHWFLYNGMQVYGIDRDHSAIEDLKALHPELDGNRLQACPVESMPFPDDYFDHLVSSAVLHFAEGPDHFFAMWQEMVRILKPGGSLFVRMASDIGIETRVKPAGSGVYLVPDGSFRFLLTRDLLRSLLDIFPLDFLEPFKTTNVDDQRCMSTLVLQKYGRP